MTPAILPRSVLEEALEKGGATADQEEDQVIMVGGEVRGPVPEGGITVTIEPVTEAVKVIEGDRVVGSLDRDTLAEPVLPLAIHGSTLRAILAEVHEDPIDLPGEVKARGGRISIAH